MAAPAQNRRGSDRRRRYRHTEERADTARRPEPEPDLEDFMYALWGVHAADSVASER